MPGSARAGMEAQARADHPIPPDFSIFRGGLVYAIGRRLGVVGDNRQLLRLGIVIALATWVPPAVLSALQTALSHGSTISFWESVGTHVRLLLTVPLFFLAEDMFDLRSGQVLRRIVQIGLVLPEEQPRLAASARQAIRARDSWLMEAGLLLLTFGLLWAGVRADLPLGISTWRSTPTGQLTPAGWFYSLVSIPIFQFLVWRWCWRLLVWTRLLWKLSRLNLQLIPIHPDAAGGLAVLGVAHVDLAPFAFGACAVLSSSYAEGILFAGVHLDSLAVPFASAVVGTTLALLLPLAFFMPQLVVAKQKALIEYSSLAADYTRAFAAKWLPADRRHDEHFLGSPDIQSLADLGSSYELIYNLRIVPIAYRQVGLVAGAAVCPFLPLILLAFPLDKLIIDSVKAVLNI